jgi:hypothetical protein
MSRRIGRSPHVWSPRYRSWVALDTFRQAHSRWTGTLASPQTPSDAGPRRSGARRARCGRARCGHDRQLPYRRRRPRQRLVADADIRPDGGLRSMWPPEAIESSATSRRTTRVIGSDRQRTGQLTPIHRYLRSANGAVPGLLVYRGSSRRPSRPSGFPAQGNRWWRDRQGAGRTASGRG